MTGAPPARYTEDRRRFVPGFGDGASGGAGRLGPFEDTTDATPLPGGTGHGSGYGPLWSIWTCPMAAATTCGSRWAFAWSERSWRAGRYMR